jgi:hypothetical protein
MARADLNEEARMLVLSRRYIEVATQHSAMQHLHRLIAHEEMRPIDLRVSVRF